VQKGVKKLADYRRFISYLYQYEKGEKGENMGFSKVESRNGACRIAINLRGVFIGQNEQCKVYALVQKRKSLYGIYLGMCPSQNGVIDYKLTTPASSIGGSRYSLDEICGVLVDPGRGKVFATGWVEKPINVKLFTLIDDTQGYIHAAELKESGDRSDDITVSNEDTGEEVMQKNTDVSESSTFVNKIIPGNNRIETNHVKDSDIESNDVNSMQRAQKRDNGDNAGGTEERGEVNSALGAVMSSNVGSAGRTAESNEVNITDKSVESSDLSRMGRTSVRNEGRIAHHSKQNFGMQQNRMKRTEDASERYISPMDKWNKLRTTYKNVRPFEDDQFQECIEIQPKDLVHLQKEDWVLGNNSFLLHGYYNYRYLIMARVEKDNHSLFVLGVPGVYENQEKLMANMFGFSNFKPAHNVATAPGEFGYWYRTVR